jgi:intein/homing endonuclease
MADMAWDIEPKRGVKLLVGIPIIPSFSYIHTVALEAWEHAWKPIGTVRIFDRSFGVATAREHITDKFLEGDWTHLAFLDADIVLQGDTLKKIIEANKPVVVGNYYETSNMRNPEAFHHSQVPFRRDPPIEFKTNEIFEFPDDAEDVFLSGLGIVMFKREVFDKIDKPYFLYSSEYEHKLKDDYWAVCILPNQIVMSDPPKYIENLNIGDSILSEDGKYHKVIKVTKRDWNSDVLKITPRTIKLPIMVTPQHKIPVYRNDKLIELMASEINPKTDKLFIAAPIEIEDVNHIDLKLPNGKEYDVPQINIDEHFMEMLGKYVGDGYVIRTKHKDGNRIYGFGLAFNDKLERDRMDYYSVYLSDLLQRKFSSLVVERDESKNRHYSASVRGSCIPLGIRLGEWFGYGATNKYLPSWILKLPKDKLIAFIRGVFEGDGFVTYSGVKKLPVYAINLSSERLILGIALCLLKLGIKCRIQEHRQYKGAYGEGNKFWRIVVSEDRDKFHEMLTGIREKSRESSDHQWTKWKNNHLLLKIDKIENIKYTGDVYDIEVEDNHTFLTRGICVHNSEDFFIMLKLQKAGIRVTYLPSIKVGHIGNCVVSGPNQINFL